ncbi:MAG: SpoIIE family protein phosphatase [Flavobacteriales bacterium]|nr:SpoIIE family protein phosphatase [Flavobacteriales bacterium]
MQTKEYRDSLLSAKIVQQGLLPKERHLNRIFKEHFVFYEPQHIISGDFYWVGEVNNLKYLVVGDCTGHGVSAALLSVLALNLLEYSIMNKKIKKVHKILQEVDKRFIESFKNSQISAFDNPWIDLSIVCIDEKENKLYYSSANRKLLLVDSEKNAQLYKGSRYPIGGWQIEENRIFDPQTIDYKTGDRIYLGSDGFQDQIGGPKNKKYKSKILHNFLVENSSYSCPNQKEILEKEFKCWKKENDQTDDVCLVGIEL